MSSEDIERIIARLGVDKSFRELVRSSPSSALRAASNRHSLTVACGVATADELRSLTSKSDFSRPEAGWTKAASCAYTQCGQCSSACTRAGCFPGPGCPRST